jgi:arginyl-tRNA synthetase
VQESDMSLLTILTEIFGNAFARVGLNRAYGEVVVSQRPELAQFQCNGALPAAKAVESSPRSVAQSVIDAVENSQHILAATAVAGPGFINISVSDEFLGGYIARVAADERFGMTVQEPRTIVVDYGGPNVAKDLHVGHLRTAVIGESLKRLLRFAGHAVVGDVHLGDWGLPMGQLIVELEDRRPDLPYFDSDYAGPYPVASPVTIDDLHILYPEAAARAKDDPEFADRAKRAVVDLQFGRAGYRALWQHFRDVSIEAIKRVYGDLGVDFDLWHGESTINDRLEPMVEKLLASGSARRSEGAIVIEVAEPTDKKKIPPMILLKSDGATLYASSDLATIEDRVDKLSPDEIIYVVDVGQSLHFEQVFRAARRSGIAPPGLVLEHAWNGTVNGEDGRRLKTRDGGVPPLKGLVQEVLDGAAKRLAENDLAKGYDSDERATITRVVAMAALKFGDLHNHRTSNYIFDVDRFTAFEGKTGPYLLYGAVRIKSILRSAADLGLHPGPIIAPVREAERNLMLQLTRLPEVIERATGMRAPNHVAEYAFEVAAEFNRFYEACHILREKDAVRQASWLALVDLVLRQLTRLLDLLGIEVPERM